MMFRIVAILVVWLIPSAAFAQLQRPSLTLVKRPGSFLLRSRPNKEQKKRLQPSAQDLTAHAEFLRLPRTGIIRLMPDVGCAENVNVIRADDVCLNYVPESSYYSFREKEHTLEMLADLRLRNNYLISDGVLTQGILVQLGEVELERLAATSEGLSFLSDFSPHPHGLEAQRQYVQMLRGVKVGGYEYKKALPLVANATYALRVVAYKGNIFRSFRGFRFDVLEGDKRIDLTLAFRVVRKETDGSVILLWKEIERREAPRLVFPPRRQNR